MPPKGGYVSMVDSEFQSRFDEVYIRFRQNLEELDKKPLECALASYIRFIETHSAKTIQIKFTRVLPRASASVTKIYPNGAVHIYVHEHYRSVVFGDDNYHTACCLIAHELAHLILEHQREYDAFRAQMADSPGVEDLAALMQILDYDADMYGAILAIIRAPVFEREYYYNNHPFVLGNKFKQTFFSDPFLNGGFLKVRELLEANSAITPPHHALAPILKKEIETTTESRLQIEGSAITEMAQKIVSSYRSTGQRLRHSKVSKP